MESTFQFGNKLSREDTIFTLARYGNVVCSNASVIPLFQRQIKENNEVTITHPDMTRFWISIDTAVDLILAALVVDPGCIVVPKAQALSICRVADILGDEQTTKRFVGIRPGEKIHEAMVHESESFHTREQLDHFLIYPPNWGQLNEKPFTYTSDKAPEMLPETLLRIIDDYDIRFN
jgi:UDP-N-acetylglucosamine 4,6-dehydratase